MENEIIAIFDAVRDIPFRIPLTLDEPSFDCSGKSRLLRKELEKIGIETRFGVCWFYWQCLKLPDELDSIAHDKDCTHTFTEALIDGRWIKLDPSWDSALAARFPVARFDGTHDTALAVTPEEFFAPNKSSDILKRQLFDADGVMTQDLERNGGFYAALNGYLEDVRRST